MTTSDSDESRNAGDAHPAQPAAQQAETAGDRSSSLATTAAVVVIVGGGAAILEAALVPGIILGVGAMLLPKVLPTLGGPVFRATVRGASDGARKARDAFAAAASRPRGAG